MDQERLRQIWRQNKIPVVVRSDEKGRKLRVRLPYAHDNRQWLNTVGKSSVTWVASDDYWELPKSWFNDFVNRALERYFKLYVIQPYREQEKCARSCMEATGHECNCSCMGRNHGAGIDGSWFEVSETFATRWKGREIACRLMESKKLGNPLQTYLQGLI
ncbi:hypothetical protein EXN32_00410 [Agrobacterium tumefaciens]|uniref:hypothetical protein n=1 Tax=Agrobacterium TaxID=357 RepID=UPI00115EDA8F|nr:MULTISPECIES: hypothetical protein [Agrobacterium]MDA5241448.1 hypothetical protein [Agrobacterium sp. MAFF310724]MDA5245495.1 hypothetical protein [Agrobacterium sp. MAFF210268]TRB18855.1 hypothetical protein EXN32_00410 [Agrobacterium tumefaciens]